MPDSQTTEFRSREELSLEHEETLAEIQRGLALERKHLPSKLFYDRTGSLLFDQICELPEYYLTRTELAILRTHAPAIARRIGEESALLEFGSGASVKVRLLLDELESLSAYVPIEISVQHLQEAADSIASDYPGLDVLPVCADYTAEFDLPELPESTRKVVGYFPGSTIGNFQRDDAIDFLRNCARLTGEGGGLVIGTDLQKDRAVLEAAYNDRRGVTAQFNKNILQVINSEFDADFDAEKFEHRAVYNERLGHIEMRLISSERQSVTVGEASFELAAEEPIVTEYSHKYTQESFAQLAEIAGFAVVESWTDPRQYFCVHYLEVV